MGPNPAWLGLFVGGTAFVMLVNSGLTAVLGGLVATGLGAPGPLVGMVAAVCGLAFLGVSVTLAQRRRRFVNRRHVPLFPAPTSGNRRSDSQPVEGGDPAAEPRGGSSRSAPVTGGRREGVPRSTPRSTSSNSAASRLAPSGAPASGAEQPQDQDADAEPEPPQESLKLIDRKIDEYRGRLAAGDADQLWAPTLAQSLFGKSPRPRGSALPQSRP